MNGSNLSRRTILKSGLLLFVGGCASQATQKGEKTMGASKCKIPVGLQLWTVRAECAKDFPGTIAKVAKLITKYTKETGYSLACPSCRKGLAEVIVGALVPNNKEGGRK